MSAFVDPMKALATRASSAALQQASTTERDKARAAVDLHMTDNDKIAASVKGTTLPAVAKFDWKAVQVDDLKAAREIVIDSKESQASAWELLKRIRATRKAVESWYDAIKKPYNAVRSAILSLADRDGTMAKTVDDLLFAKIDAYDVAERQREERERLQREADERLLAEHTQQQAAAALDRHADEQDDPALRDALKTEAAAIAAAPVQTPAVKVTSNRAVVKGAFFRETWTGHVTDQSAFLKAIIAGKIPMNAITVNQTWLNQSATSLKENMGKVFPGTAAKSNRSAGTR